MKIGNLSKRACALLVVLLLAAGVATGYGCTVILSRTLLNTYSAGTVVPSLPANVTINAPLNWGNVTQGQNYTLTRVLTNMGAATGPLYLLVTYPPSPLNVNFPIYLSHSSSPCHIVTPANITLLTPFNVTFPLLSWDANGKTIPANATLTVVFTLQVPAYAALGTFNETISILD